MATKSTLFVFVSLFLALTATLAAPITNSSVCTSPRIRKEWRSLTVPERKDYIRAVRCMMDSPPKSKKYFSVVQNRYDDFVALHANSTGGGLKLDGWRGWEEMRSNPFRMATTMMNGIHGTGTFLPWHRYAIKVYEDALRDECGWQGGQPYWDWHLDTPEAGGTWLKSPVFDPISGFGGNGAYVNQSSFLPPGFDLAFLTQMSKMIPGFEVPMIMGSGGGCVLDGPFKNRTLNIGPMGQMTPNNTRCLIRSMNEPHAHQSASKKNIAKVLSAKTFTEFRAWMEAPNVEWSISNKGLNVTNHGGDLHDIGHAGVGGEMLDLFNSANDPLFWMHHTGMDRIWALWQEQDPARVLDVGKPSSFFDFSAPTLKSMMWMGFAAPDQPVGTVMDTLNRDGRGVLCYKYEGLSADKYL